MGWKLASGRCASAIAMSVSALSAGRYEMWYMAVQMG